MVKLDTPPTPELLYLCSGDPAELAELAAQMRSADLAEALNDLPRAAAAKVVANLPFHVAVQALDEPEMECEDEILALVPEATATELVEAMSADRQADLFRAMPETQRTRLIRTLQPETQAALRELLRYARETAGGIMTTELVSVPAAWTVDRVLRHIHEVGRAKETVYAIYVHDPDTRALVHVVSLRELIVAERSAFVLEVGDRRAPVTVPLDMDREEVARLISKYDLLAVPVVDEQGRVIGIVTVDDVIDAIVAEQTEDVQKFGGMEALDRPYMQIGFLPMLKKRAGWLSALFIGETLTATAMGGFEHEIAQAVVLALFIPLIISSGGNSGGQSTSLIIRALALREVEVRDWWRVLLRELPTGLALGAILGLIGAMRLLL